MPNPKLTPTMLLGLQTVARKDPKPTTIAWRTGPHMVASGTANALVDRGFCTKVPGPTFGDFRLQITDEGRTALEGTTTP